MKRAGFILLSISCFALCNAQEFERTQNKATGDLIISFADFRQPAEIPFIITKTIRSDSTVVYRLGCYMVRNAVPVDLFMKTGAVLNQENMTSMVLQGEIQSSPIYGGKFQIHLKQELSITELKALQVLAIESFNIGGFSVVLDKWARQELKKIFTAIEMSK